jgi:hypothetical protein
MLNDLITTNNPTDPLRIRGTPKGIEECLSEAAVMIAFAMYLLHGNDEINEVFIHPDGEHKKKFAFDKWFENNNFSILQTTKSSAITYERSAMRIMLHYKPGIGDVRVTSETKNIIAECKGGVINSTHSGHTSRLRKGLYEVIGLLMTKDENCRRVAVVPDTKTTYETARKLIAQTSRAGIEIALVDRTGNVRFISN